MHEVKREIVNLVKSYLSITRFIYQVKLAIKNFFVKFLIFKTWAIFLPYVKKVTTKFTIVFTMTKNYWTNLIIYLS